MKSSELEDLFRAQLGAERVPPFVAEYRFAPPRRWRFDFAWPELMIAVEIEGCTWARGRHNRGSGFEADCEKYNRAAVMGWVVLRGTGKMVEDRRLLEMTKGAIWTRCQNLS